jgi:Rps23 Pro-64 3,4-dihydroxylase Tpa1-like proline 4-hydroxylase
MNNLVAIMELINPFDRESLKLKIKNSQPFPNFHIDNFLKEAFAEEVYNAFPSFEQAQKVGKGYHNVNEKLKIQITDANVFPAPIKRLNELLSSAEFLEMVSDLMGIPELLADPDLVGGGIHETNSGGHLDVHVDFNMLKDKNWHRRLNILMYFNKDWKDEYGGFFEIWDKDVKKCYGSFAPIFNRVFIFTTSDISFHGVTPLTCPPDIMRKSFAAYYYTKEAPENWNGKHHSTIFKSRPDEWLKGGILMPAERTFRLAKQQYKLVKAKLKNLIGK